MPFKRESIFKTNPETLRRCFVSDCDQKENLREIPVGVIQGERHRNVSSLYVCPVHQEEIRDLFEARSGGSYSQMDEEGNFHPIELKN